MHQPPVKRATRIPLGACDHNTLPPPATNKHNLFAVSIALALRCHPLVEYKLANISLKLLKDVERAGGSLDACLEGDWNGGRARGRCGGLREGGVCKEVRVVIRDWAVGWMQGEPVRGDRRGGEWGGEVEVVCGGPGLGRMWDWMGPGM